MGREVHHPDGRGEQTRGTPGRRRSSSAQGRGSDGTGHTDVPKGRLTLQKPSPPTEGFGQKARASRGPGRDGRDGGRRSGSGASETFHEARATWPGLTGSTRGPRALRSTARSAGRRRWTSQGDLPGARAATERQRYARRRTRGRERSELLASPPKPAAGVNRAVAGSPVEQGITE